MDSRLLPLLPIVKAFGELAEHQRAMVQLVETIESAWREYDKGAPVGLQRRHLQVLFKQRGQAAASVAEHCTSALRVSNAALESPVHSDAPLELMGAHDFGVVAKAIENHELQMQQRRQA